MDYVCATLSQIAGEHRLRNVLDPDSVVAVYLPRAQLAILCEADDLTPAQALAKLEAHDHRWTITNRDELLA